MKEKFIQTFNNVKEACASAEEKLYNEVKPENEVGYFTVFIFVFMFIK